MQVPGAERCPGSLCPQETERRRQVDGDRVQEPDTREGPKTEKAEGNGAKRDGGRHSHPSASPQLSLQPLIRAVHACFLSDLIQPHGSKHMSPRVTPHPPRPLSAPWGPHIQPLGSRWAPSAQSFSPNTPSHLHTNGATNVTASRPRQRHAPCLLSPPSPPSTRRVLDAPPLPFLFAQGPQPLPSGGLLPPPISSLVSPLPSHPTPIILHAECFLKRNQITPLLSQA